MSNIFDLAIIGGGPAGYVGAIRAAQLGMRVVLMDKRKVLGGTCLNVGCIPSKFLLRAAHAYGELVGGELAEIGVLVSKPGLDIGRMMQAKQDVVASLVGGIGMLMKKNKVEHMIGAGKILGKNDKGGFEVEVEGAKLEAARVLIATGSESKSLPGMEFDGERIISSTEALDFDAPPKRLLVVGAGVIGLELGSVWSALGSKVVIFEAMDQILAGFDISTARKCQRIFEKQGLEFKLGVKIDKVDVQERGVKIALVGGEIFKGDKLLLAAGRRPVSEGLNLDKLGIKTDTGGFIEVDAGYATTVEGIYAVGDVIGGMMLAHKASDEAVALIESLAGIPAKLNYGAIPGVVYTHPEVAQVGANEAALKRMGKEYVVGNFFLAGNSRTRVQGKKDGWVRLFCDKNTKRVLGGEVVADGAGEMINEIALAIEFSASAEDIALTSHAHPSVSEAIREAALSATSGAIHS